MENPLPELTAEAVLRLADMREPRVLRAAFFHVADLPTPYDWAQKMRDCLLSLISAELSDSDPTWVDPRRVEMKLPEPKPVGERQTGMEPIGAPIGQAVPTQHYDWQSPQPLSQPSKVESAPVVPGTVPARNQQPIGTPAGLTPEQLDEARKHARASWDAGSVAVSGNAAEIKGGTEEVPPGFRGIEPEQLERPGPIGAVVNPEQAPVIPSAKPSPEEIAALVNGGD